MRFPLLRHGRAIALALAAVLALCAPRFSHASAASTAAPPAATPAASAAKPSPGAARPAAPQAPDEVAPRASGPGLAIATFAGGCFWCVETAFEGRPGVVSVVSGYTGGPERNPTYEQVSGRRTGHAEAVEIRFDPRRITYEQLLHLFWRSIDPTQPGGQFCDHGPQYRSAIFVHDDEQRRLAHASKRALERSGVLKRPIVTQIVPASTFWPAEEYHQDFWRKDPERYRSYRAGCGRDRRLAELWGREAVKPLVH
uniref:Peptide methionine sulfoxide reductase MsrA n=1 Tax=Eiseniibacteriota bacterium TaxID=2212470 RepID=A0A832MKH2_UNCEI